MDAQKRKGPEFQAPLDYLLIRQLERKKEWRVGKLAHDSLRSRCPRAAPNPFFRDYACVLGRPMGQRSHETGYVGCSTAGPFLDWLKTLYAE
jgi:hypothetical protein